MTLDSYTKFILTMLTIGVWLLAASVFFNPAPIRATEQQDINLDRIGGTSIYGALPVEVQGTVTIDFAEEPVFELED